MIRNRTPVVAAVCVLLLLLATTARAAWPTDGLPVVQAAGTQSTPVLAPDAQGGAWIAWADARGGGDESDIYARHLAVDGTPLGPPVGIAVATAAGRQEAPTIAPDGQGGCIIVWQDRRQSLTGSDLYMQRLNAAGQPLWTPGGLALLVTFGDQTAPRIVREAYGSWVVTWQDLRYPGNPSIYAQRIQSSGMPVWLNSGVPVSRAVDAQLAPRILADRVGGVVIVWSDRRNGLDYDLYGQRLDYGGAALWPVDGRALATGPGDQCAPLPPSAPAGLALDAGDGVYLAWADTKSGTSDVMVQRIDGSGVPVAGWPAEGRPAAEPPRPRDTPGVVADDTGGVLVSFRERLVSGDDRLYAARLSPNGVSLWAPEGVSVTPDSAARGGPVPAPDGHGGVFLAWSAAEGEDPGNIRVQWIDDGGVLRLAPGGFPFCGAAAAQEAPAALAGPPSDLFVAWTDLRAGTPDLFGYRLSGGLGNLSLAAWPAAFAAPLIPRAAADSLPDAGVLPPALPGNAPAIRFNEAFQLQSSTALPAFRSIVSLDGKDLQETAYPAGFPAGDVVTLNGGPHLVRGGRHTLALRLDAFSEIPEDDEDDNLWSAQYVFEPLPLAAGQALRRPAPPLPGDGDQPNSDGFRWDAPGGVAWALAVGAAEPDIEETFLLYEDYTGLEDGFSILRQGSAEPGDGIELLLGDRTTPAATLYPAIARAEDFGHLAGSVIAAQTAEGRQLDRFPFLRGPETLPSDHLVHIYEVYLEAGFEREFLLQRDSGSADLEMALFATTGEVVTQTDAKVVSTPVDPATDRFVHLPDASGWYPLAVYRRFAHESVGAVTYRLYGLDARSAAPLPSEPLRLALRVAPNPLGAGGRLEYRLPVHGPVTLDLFDIRGRRLRRYLERTSLGPGDAHLDWDGRDATGHRLPAGRYLLRLEAAGAVRTVPLTIVH